MHNTYDDILTRVPDPPVWWDSNGVPRWCNFHPSKCPDIYADEAVLLRIACQGCGTQFDVELHSSRYDKRRLSEAPQEIFYGDPPNVGCCPAGATMSSVSLHVIEFWQRGPSGWTRNKPYENLQIDDPKEYFGEEHCLLMSEAKS